MTSTFATGTAGVLLAPNAPSNAAKDHRTFQVPSEGDMIEVRWSLAVTVQGGRQEGQVIYKAVWWKSRVKGMKNAQDRTLGVISYAPGYGMDQTDMPATFYRQRLRHEDSGKDIMSLQPWRFARDKHALAEETLSSNCTGSDEDYKPPPHLGSRGIVCKIRKGRTSPSKDIDRRLVTLQLQVDELQRICGAQSALFARLLGSTSQSDLVANRIFTYLRQKIVMGALRGLQFPRIRSAVADVENESGRFLDSCFTTVLKAEADCSLSEYEHIARAISVRSPGAVFQPSFAETQAPRYDQEASYVLFDSFQEISHCIGLNGLSDLLALMGKGRKVFGRDLADDSALRLLGGTLSEKDDPAKPFAFRVGGSIHSSFGKRECDLLWRQSMEFDNRQVMYSEGLEKKNMLISEALGVVGSTNQDDVRYIAKKDSVFMLGWSRISSSKARHLSKSLRTPDDVLGTLEISWPSLVVRGRRVVAEFQGIVTQQLLRRALKR